MRMDTPAPNPRNNKLPKELWPRMLSRLTTTSGVEWKMGKDEEDNDVMSTSPLPEDVAMAIVGKLCKILTETSVFTTEEKAVQLYPSDLTQQDYSKMLTDLQGYDDSRLALLRGGGLLVGAHTDKTGADEAGQRQRGEHDAAQKPNRPLPVRRDGKNQDGDIQR